MKDFLIQSAVTTVGSTIVGAPIKIGYMSVGLLTQKVLIKNFKLYNPPGFPNGPLVDIPEIKVSCDLLSFFKGRLHLPMVVFNMKEMVVIKDKEGKLNVDSLKMIQEQKAEIQKQAASGKASKQMPIKIDELKLNVERVILKDFSQKGAPTVLDYEIDLKDKTFKDINSVEQMVTLVMVQVMGHTAIKSAGVYAAATVLGVGFLPAGVVGVLVGKDSASAEFNANPDKAFETTVDLIKKIGELKSEERVNRVIKGNVAGADVTIKVEALPNKKTQVFVIAKQVVLPKPEVAGGIIYQLKEILR